MRERSRTPSLSPHTYYILSQSKFNMKGLFIKYVRTECKGFNGKQNKFNIAPNSTYGKVTYHEKTRTGPHFEIDN